MSSIIWPIKICKYIICIWHRIYIYVFIYIYYVFTYICTYRFWIVNLYIRITRYWYILLCKEICYLFIIFLSSFSANSISSPDSFLTFLTVLMNIVCWDGIWKDFKYPLYSQIFFYWYNMIHQSPSWCLIPSKINNLVSNKIKSEVKY